MKISKETISFKYGTWVHKKTGNTYKLITLAIDCTNVRDGTEVAVYTNGDKVFVREKNEFIQKFAPETGAI